MYKIDTKSIKKLGDINNLLNQLEIRGISNISILYKSMLLLQEVVTEIDESNKDGIVIDNTKGA